MFFRQICTISPIAMGVSVCVCVYVTLIHAIIPKIKNVENDVNRFNICHRMASLRKLYSVTSTYFLKVKDANQDLLTVASNHSGATCMIKDSNRNLPKVVNAQSCPKCKRLLCYATNCMALAVEFLLFLNLISDQ